MRQQKSSSQDCTRLGLGVLGFLFTLLQPASNLVSAGVHAPQATYHVATGGSDLTGNGSLATPWATITHALNNVPDGSTITTMIFSKSREK